MFFKNNKAVSPLIATVLLIAFTIALGAVVMNWGKGFVEATAKDTGDKANSDLSCQQDIELSVKEIGGVPKICYNTTNSYIKVMLENGGRVDITGMQYAFFDVNDGINITQNTTLTISAGGVSAYMTVPNGLAADISQVEFTPMIKIKGATSSQLCSKNVLVVDNIVSC